jgi:rubrerythrin
MARKTRQEFIEDARKVWGNQYDYSQVDYVNSKTKVLIRCIKHDETFLQTPFAHNIMKRQGCPKCQEIRKKSMKYKKHLPIVKYDDYIKEWDCEKNKDRDPNTLTVGTSYKVWWKCSVCGHSWKASPNARILRGSNCPICSVKNANAERIKKKGSFADNFPERAKDWDYEKNGELLPTQVTAGSNIEVCWKCHVCGYEWKSMVVSHAKAKFACEKCSYREKSLKRFGNKPLVETHPQLAEEWDYISVPLKLGRVKY